jgi:uncharacterized membrane protein YphA (DoxX/SURF4 family)
LHRKRWANLCVAILRILLGFAFLPAGLKKALDQPFTDPSNTGAFHEFLHAFQATGFFYQFVGFVQLTIAVLLMTQTFATLGALMAVPVFVAITVFCWSTSGIFTAIMATLMLAGVVGLSMWDFETWCGVVGVRPAPPPAASTPPIAWAMWRGCGVGILVLYLGVCAYAGGIYRPRGVEVSDPAFYIFPLIALFPVVTLVLEQRKRRAAS